tara:strand:- start:203 stop:637 length:435 start_codon:yes stop_codon:yes gene_type:complete
MEQQDEATNILDNIDEPEGLLPHQTSRQLTQDLETPEVPVVPGFTGNENMFKGIEAQTAAYRGLRGMPQASFMDDPSSAAQQSLIATMPEAFDVAEQAKKDKGLPYSTLLVVNGKKIRGTKFVPTQEWNRPQQKQAFRNFQNVG